MYKLLAVLSASSTLTTTAFAQDFAATHPAAATFDLTAILVSICTGIFGVLAIVIPYIINARMKDSKDAATMANAIKNSLGAMEQATTGTIVMMHPQIAIPGVPASIQPAVQYALNHAGTEFERAGITPLAVADKINAQIGLAKAAQPTVVVAAPDPAQLAQNASNLRGTP